MTRRRCARRRRYGSKRCPRRHCGCWRWCSRFSRHHHRFHECFRWRVRRRSRFRFDLGPQCVGSARVAHAFPTAFHRYVRDLLFETRWRRCGLRLANYRRGYFDDVTFHDGPQGFGFQIYVGSALHAQALDRLLCLPLQFVVVRPMIHDGGVVISDVRDVHRLIHDGDILLRSHDYRRDSLRSKLARRQK